MTNKNQKWPTWLRDDKSVVSCTEKVKVMNENFDELKQIAQDAFDDGVLMEVSEKQMKKILFTLIFAFDLTFLTTPLGIILYFSMASAAANSISNQMEYLL